jgi:uncharacterized protein
MPARADSFDLARLNLRSGEGRRIDLEVELGSFRYGEAGYAAEPAVVPVRLDISRMTGNGWALRLRFDAALRGPCMRCLEEAAPTVSVDAREIDQPGGGDDLESPYVDGEELDLRQWAHDAFALALPAQVLCRPDCAGLCAQCGADLNTDPGHTHGPTIDPRWAKLGELRLED